MIRLTHTFLAAASDQEVINLDRQLIGVGLVGKRRTAHDDMRFGGRGNCARCADERGSLQTALETLKRRVTSGWPVSIMRSQFSRGPRLRSQQLKDRFAAEPSPHGDPSKREVER